MVIPKKVVPAGDAKGKEVTSSVVREHVLKPSALGYPEDKDQREILAKNLQKMGCGRLWNLPWRYSDEFLLREVSHQRSVAFKDGFRGKPDRWTSKVLAQKWHLLLEGKKLPSRKNNQAEQYFSGKPSGRDGWKLTDCSHQELREVLEFLIPLLNPNKPKRMTVQVASPVADCLINGTKYSWAKIFEERIKNQVVKLQMLCVSYLAAFCLNLYAVDGLVTKKEKKAWVDLKWSLRVYSGPTG
jgi:hypothetical protein